MEQQELIHTLNNDLAIELHEQLNADEILITLSEYVNHLIKTDFEKLVALLYRIDVHEGKLKHLLIDHPDEDAGKIIAVLIIERMQQKIKFKKQFTGKIFPDDDEEKW
jgi:Mg/Co/Ni transporter MgtE